MESLRRGGEGAKRQKRTSLHSLSIRAVIGQQHDTHGRAGVHACCGADCAYTLERTRHWATAFIPPFTHYPGISLLSSVMFSSIILSAVIHTLFTIVMTLYLSPCHFLFPELESFPFPLFPFLFNSIIRPPHIKLKNELTFEVLQQLLNFAQTTTGLKICGHWSSRFTSLVLVRFHRTCTVSVPSAAVVYWSLNYLSSSSVPLRNFLSVLHFLCPWLDCFSEFSLLPSPLPHPPILSCSFTLSVTLSRGLLKTFPHLSVFIMSSFSPLLSFCPPPRPRRCTQCHCSDNYLLTCLCRHRPCLLLPSVPS